MKRIAIPSLILFIAISFALISCKGSKPKNKITVAVASNMQYAMEAIVAEFTAETGIHCDLVTASSGKLTAQIVEGAPFHIFMSADMKYPEEILKSGLAESPPKIYAYGKLVLWTTKEGIMPEIDLLTDKSITHIALANPKTAPYGEAALSVLEHFELMGAVGDKLVYGESISQTNQFIISQSAEIGFTAKAVVLSPEMRGKGSWMAIDEALYSPIEQGVVLIKPEGDIPPGAIRFYDFLFDPAAKQILKNFGYSVDE